MTQFRRSYNRIALLTGIALALITLGIEYFQYNHNKQLLLIDLKNRLNEHTMNMNLRARTIRGYVNGLRNAAENSLFYIRQFGTTSPLFPFLKNNRALNSYDLDLENQNINKGLVSNLTGLGNIKDISDDLKAELQMALFLNPFLEMALRNNRGAVWTYYTSQNHFQNLYPWTPSHQNFYHKGLESKFFFQGAIPEKNPERQNFWTEAYQDGIADGVLYQKGIVVTNSSPIYEGDRFLGVVSLDLSLSELNRVMKRFNAFKGSLLLINKNHQVLATNGDNSSRAQGVIPHLEQFVPTPIIQRIDQEMKAPSGWFSSYNSSIFYIIDMHEAPWYLVYVGSKSDLFMGIYFEALENIIVITAILIFVVGMGYLLMIHDVISPAQKLVDHISKVKRGEKSTFQKIPARWQPWFDIISHTFEENRALMTDLENRVKLRTKQLQQKNSQLEKTLSDLKKAQNQIIVQEKLASLGALTAGIAHEIKNPLNFIINFSDLSIEYLHELKNKVSDENKLFSLIEENMIKTKEHAARADSIVKGMLAHARGSTGEITIFNLHKLLDDAIELAYIGFQGKETDFTTKFTKEFDPTIQTIHGSEQDLARVFLNIINNSCFAMHEKQKKFGKGYRPELTVKTRSLGKSIQITFEDNGPGMSGAVLKKIFTPFFTTKEPGKGTGLGLSLSYDIVTHQHHGQITVKSKIGKSSQFTIELPKET